MTITPATARAAFGRACLGAAAVTAALTVWILTEFGGRFVTAAVDDVVETVAPFLAALACVLAGRRAGAVHLRRGWQFLAASAAAWGTGQAMWSYYELVAHRALPFPSLADVGYLAAVPLVVVALLLFVRTPAGARSRVRTLLEGLIIASSTLFCSWALVLGPIYGHSTGSVFAQAIGLAYPAGDVVTASIVLFAVTRAQSSRRLPLGLVGVGLVAMAVADSGFAYFTTVSAYDTGNVIDVGWVVGYLLIALAALRAMGHDPEEAEPERRPVGRLAVALPYLMLAIAAVVAAFHGLSAGRLGPFLLWNALIVVVLVMAHQVSTVLENHALTSHLEELVRARTAELARQERHFRALVQNASDVITVVGADRRVLYQSPSGERLHGRAPAALVGSAIEALFSGEDVPRMAGAVEHAMTRSGANTVVEAALMGADGADRHTETTIVNLLHEPGVEGLVLTTRDVTERKCLEDQLAHQAFHDSLTGLANRALFLDRIEHALARRGRDGELVAVLFLDLDRFKAINDSFGHGVGDELLVETAARLRSCVRPGDTVARIGGDEFAALLEPVSDVAQAEEVAKRILEAVAMPVRLAGREVVVEASLGIASNATGRNDPEELVRDADVAMYLAKAAGSGGHALYDPRMQAALVARVELEADLRHAVERGELVLQFQPFFGLATGALVGVEALVRWNHPRRGMLAPLEFIPLAEETGLIVPIGRWVLEEACRHAQRWREHSLNLDGSGLTMAVNLSGRQLHDPDLLDDVHGALGRTDLSAAALVVEVTESVLVDDVTTLGRLTELKALGVRLAIDDFGTGYSSLSYLRRFPVDILKIDRSFVAGIETDTEQAALAQAIVELGRVLHLVTVAEGVETAEQLTALQGIGCDEAQGFYLARPMNADRVSELLGCAPSADETTPRGALSVLAAAAG